MGKYGQFINLQYVGQDDISHKVLIYIEHYSKRPLVGIGTPLTPLPQASVPLLPKTEGVGIGANSPVAEGEGESQFRRLEKKLITLPTL
jgi:hypothetical protein